jgi:SPP1 gp7 family putative phage head morphogenesis protein
MAESIHAILDDNIVGHMVTVERLKAGERLKVLRLLKRLEGQLVKELAENSPVEVVRTAFQQRRLESLLVQTRETIRTAYSGISREVQRDLTALAQAEVGLSLTDLNGAFSKVLSDTAGFPIQLELASVRLSAEQLRVIASDVLISGASTNEWWRRQALTTQRRFGDVIRTGMLRGETTPQITRAVRDMMGIQSRSAETLVRSSVQAVATTVQQNVWEQNEQLIEALIWQSTLDLKTSVLCIARDQKRYRVQDKKPIGHTIPWLEGPGRIHPRCRSAPRPQTALSSEILDARGVVTGGRPTTPRAVFEARLRELRPDLTDDIIASTIQNARAALDGPVGISTTFEQWLRRRTVAEQNDRLGVGKAKLWRAGKISFSDLLDFRGNPLTLEQLLAKQ